MSDANEVRCESVRSRAGKEHRCELKPGHAGPHYSKVDAQGPFLWTGTLRPFGSLKASGPTSTAA